jgi:ethanolamine permease
VGAVLLNMAVFGAVISYGLQMTSFILLRRHRPEMERPYRSPLGVPGALLALAISAVTLGALFYVDATYRNVVLGALVWFSLGLLWFGLVGRHGLVYSPEESFAQGGGDD